MHNEETVTIEVANSSGTSEYRRQRTNTNHSDPMTNDEAQCCVGVHGLLLLTVR